jgi:perosamine synthetase
MIPIYKPYLRKYTKSAINAIESEWISNYGIYVELASKKLTDILGNKYCILMNNGTSATHCLFKAVKFKYPEIKKIYVPNNVFIAPINCALMEYNKDIIEITKTDPFTLNMDTSEEYLQTLDKNACLVIVHNLGNIINVPRLKKLRPDLIIIEDNCEGLFGKYENKYSGTESLCSAVSFYANKTITTGEGGAFFTNDIEIYKYIKNIYSHGMTEKRYIHNNIGNNFRMTNVEAGFLYDQINDYENIVNLKKKKFEIYDKLLLKYINDKKIVKLKSEKNTENSYWMYCIIIPGLKYEILEKFLEMKNIQIRPLFYDMSEHYHIKDIKKSNNISNISNSGLMLPSYPELSEEEQKYIVNNLSEFIEVYF